MLRLALALFLLSLGSATAEEGFLPYDADVGLTGTVFNETSTTPMLRLDKPVNVGGSPIDYQNGTTFRNVTVMQIAPHDEHVTNRLRAFAKSRISVRGWLSQPIVAGQNVVLSATEVEPVKANGSP